METMISSMPLPMKITLPGDEWKFIPPTDGIGILAVRSALTPALADISLRFTGIEISGRPLTDAADFILSQLELAGFIVEKKQRQVSEKRVVQLANIAPKSNIDTKLNHFSTILPIISVEGRVWAYILMLICPQQDAQALLDEYDSIVSSLTLPTPE